MDNTADRLNMTLTSTARTPSRFLSLYYPWVVISLCAAFLFYKYILQVSPSVMTSQLMAKFHVNGAGLGVLTASYFYTYLIAQLFIGPLLDRYSPRLLSAFALTVSALGAFGFAMSHGLLSSSISRGLMGFGAAFATVAYLKLAIVWFKPKQLALVSGLLATAAMVGSMAGQAPLAYLMTKVGWQGSLFYCGALGLVITVIFYAVVRDKNPLAPAEAPLHADHKSVGMRDFLSVLKHKHNWYLMFYSGLAFCPLAIFGGLWGNPFLEEAHNLSALQASSLTSMMFLGLAIGGPVLGFIADKMGKRYEMMLFGVLLSFVGLASVIYIPHLSTWQLGFSLFILGFGTGAFMLCFAVGRDVNPVVLAATVIAVINSGDAIFGSFTEPFIGKVLDFFWDGKILHGVHYFSVHSYYIALAILPLYLLGALAFLILLKPSCKHARLL